MESVKWEQVKEIFDKALRLAPDERRRFISNNCGDDEELRREVESLLSSFDDANGFLQKPAVGEVAEKIISINNHPTEGQRISHYEIIKQIGEGGMGEVYLAKDLSLNRKVALKLLAVHITEDKSRVSRFRQEAFAASALNHPNIVTIYEIGKWQDRDFIATEFIEGATLRSLLQKKKLAVGEILDIALQVASALSAAHGAGVVHRDIKPENIMLREDGLVKVLDFGIAKYRPTEKGQKALVETEVGEVIGTAAYMSPEQARGLEIDVQTDVWSLGVILYEMIARRLPFDGKTKSDRIAAILEREPAPLAKNRRRVSPELERIVSRALAKDKAKRYVEIAPMAEDLRRLRETTGDKYPPAFVLPARKFTAPRRFYIGMAAALLIICVTVFGYYFWTARSVPSDDKKSIAVLPFVNESGNAEVEYLSDGISESLINSLSQLKQLKVVARTTAFTYKNSQTDPREAGRRLGVDTVLTGKVTLRGDTLIVQTDLINVADGSQIWGEHYTRQLADLLSVQENIAREILSRLQPRLSGEFDRQLAELNPNSSRAYQFYLKGRFFWNRRTEEEIKKGIGYFEQAIAEDPAYALAYVGLADAYNVMGFYSFLSPAESFPKAKQAAKKALELNAEMAEAYNSLAYATLYYDWDFAAAEKGFVRAIELQPNYSVAHQWYGNLLTAMGRWDEALKEFERAQELDPLSPIITAVPAWTYIYARQYDNAFEPCRKSLELDQNFAPARNWLGQAYERKGEYDKAVAEFTEALKLSDGSPEISAMLAHAHAVSGNERQARIILDDLLKLSKQRYVSPYHIAIVYAGLGDRERSLEWLEAAVGDKQNLLIFLRFDARMDDLRSDSRFQNIIKKTGLPQ